MEERESALQEILETNEAEVARWEAYIQENLTAEQNLKMFSQDLNPNVMVPVGKYAFLPGCLIHTNEVLVAHFQNYFSKCSAAKAEEICRERIEKARNHLEKLATENDLFKNKLEKPYLDGVVPTGKEREIIEEYDEEKEKVWKEEHRQRVKLAKLKEKQEREKISETNSSSDILDSLDEEELLRELNEDLTRQDTEVQKNADDLVKKIMTGEMKLPPPKPRIAHTTRKAPVKRDHVVDLNSNHIHNTSSSTTSRESPTRFVPDNKSLLSENYDILTNNHEVVSDDEESIASTVSDTPEEVVQLEKEANYLTPAEQIGFYQYQLKIIDKKIATKSFTNSEELEAKLRLFKVRDHLEELIDILQDPGTSDNEAPSGSESEPTAENSQQQKPKRRISFALEDQFLEFRKEESVAEMISTHSPEEAPKREIITIDDKILNNGVTEKTPEDNSQKDAHRKNKILEKVDQSIKAHNTTDGYLIDKIINEDKVITLNIKFKHSDAVRSDCLDSKEDVPGTPADFYKMYLADASPTTEDSSIIKDRSGKENGYVDPRLEFLAPPTQQAETSVESKSILKNKSAVEQETRVTEKEDKSKTKKKKRPEDDGDDFCSVYNKVMSDVWENPATEPDPLPQEDFVDMHAPKKRISRFKASKGEKK